jgi:hypothetical protein
MFVSQASRMRNGFGREPGDHCAVDVMEEFLGSAVFFVFGFLVL